MILPFLLLSAAIQSGPASPTEARFDHCVDLAVGDPAAAEAEAGRWQVEGGGFLARQCLGMAYATEGHWATAAGAFEDAAHAAEVARDARAANYWQQAGNAWINAKDLVKARAAFDAALASGSLTGLALGETHLDRARALEAAGDSAGARVDIDRALETAKADPLAWLLSATLARRMGDITRARTDIAQALKLAEDDATVAIEAGNIAAVQGDEAGAKAAWSRARTLAPDSPTGREANALLAQFETPAVP